LILEITRQKRYLPRHGMSILETRLRAMIKHLRDEEAHSCLRLRFASAATRVGKRIGFSHRQMLVGSAAHPLAMANPKSHPAYSSTSLTEGKFELELVSPRALATYVFSSAHQVLSARLTSTAVLARLMSCLHARMNDSSLSNRLT
jgi:hypothetical protein